jgi:hypothetical protein
MGMKIAPSSFRRGSKNKYGAKPTQIGDITFDSKLEAQRWCELQLLERGREILDLRRQVAIELLGQYRPLFTRTGRKMKLTFDFAYIEDGVQYFEDAKGMPTRDYEVRVAVARAMGLEIREVTKTKLERPIKRR